MVKTNWGARPLIKSRSAFKLIVRKNIPTARDNKLVFKLILLDDLEGVGPDVITTSFLFFLYGGVARAL